MPHSYIYSTNKIELYKPILWQGQPVYKQYSKLRNFLIKNLGNDYKDLFSEPIISDNHKGKANWSNENSSEIVSFSNCSEEIKSVLKEKLSVVSDFCNSLLGSTLQQDRDWGQLLTGALTLPNDTVIFYQDNKIVLALWGFEFRESSNLGFSIGKEFASKAKAPIKITNENQSGENKGNIALSDNFENNVQKKLAPEKFLNTENNIIENTDEKKRIIENDNVIVNKDIEKKKKSKSKSWIWLLIPLIVLPICWLLFNYFNQNNFLPPEHQKIVPIDSTKIIISEDSVRYIVSDIINIALVGDNKNIKEFAKEFKKVYPQKEYQVIYFDTTEIHKLQIQIPATEREKVLKELKGKFKGFELLVWQEGLMEHSSIPNDPSFNDISKSYYIKEILADKAWDISQGDPKVVVAIIDDGFDLTHPEFKGKIYKPWNAVYRNSKVNIGKNSSHGTHVAGLALAMSNNSFGISGIAPKCKFMPIQVGDYFGKMSSSAIIDGFIYAINNGANVINMSLGMHLSPHAQYLPIEAQKGIINNYYKDEEKFWNQLFALAYKKNISVVLASGNDNVLIGIDPMQRNNKTIKVSAVDNRNNKAAFSNYGAGSTISAPGVGIFSSVPNNKFAYMDGTSMAAPIISGCIALLKSVNPSLSFNQLVELIQSTGIPVNSNKSMGPLIQIGKAMSVAVQGRKKMPIADCDGVQQKIDSLLQEIDKLQNSCNYKGTPTNDTLKIPENSNNLNFTKGRWKSTTDIRDVSNNMRVVLYFDFNGSKDGSISLVRSDNIVCNANVKIDLINDKMNISQQNGFVCPPQIGGYIPYNFVCKADLNGCAVCNAKGSYNNFKFNLIKIK
jgi:subtilisin family serine protease